MNSSARAVWGYAVMAGVAAALIEAVFVALGAGDVAPFVFVYALGLSAPLVLVFAIVASQVARVLDSLLQGAVLRPAVAVVTGGAMVALASYVTRPVGATGAAVVAATGLVGSIAAFRLAGAARWRVPLWLIRVVVAALPFATWGFFSAFDLTPPPFPFYAVSLVALFAAMSFIPRRATAVLGGVRGVVVVLGVFGTAVGVTLATFDGQSTASEQVNRHAFFGSRFVAAWQSLVDRDGDGFSTILGGGDCDDTNPKVGPAECATRNATAETQRPKGGEKSVKEEEARSTSIVDAGVGSGEKPNIVLITVDAMRADHLGVYGYARPTSPNLDRFAREHAVLFKWAFSADTKTKPSVPALFSGRYASTLNWTKPRYVPLKPGNRFIAERLRDAGYHTAGIATHTYFAKYNHINQGFEHWDTSLVSTDDDVAFGRPTSHLVTDKILATIDSPARRARPIFLWAHYFDPHQKYLTHREFAAFGGKTINRYDQEVAFTDKHLGRLFDALQRRADWRRTIIVVTADHGEAFGEHGHRFHGEALFNEQLRVPLIIRVPGEPARVVERPVSLIDVAPTLVALVGLPPDSRFHGANLLDPVALQRPVFAELLPENHIQGQKAMIDGPHKLIYHETRNYFLMFNYVSDPAEKKNLVKTDPERFAAMRGALLKWAAGLPKWTEMGEPP